jgi:septal ring factor EnvC (AmiA/AmiB activator)
MSDRLALAHVIEDAGIPRDKAENVATAIARFIEGSAATKADVQASETALRADIQALRRDVHTFEAAIRHVQASEAKLAAEAARLDARIERTFTRLGSLAVVLSGIIIATLHYWQPHP